MAIDSWQPAGSGPPDVPDPEAADQDAWGPGADPTAAPVTAIGSDPEATPDAANVTPVQLMFRDGRPSALSLAPDWRSRVPAVTLGLTLTDQLAQHHTDDSVATEPDESRMLGLSRMPVAVARDTQLRLAEVQDNLLAHLPAMSRTPGETVTSAHHSVTVTVAAGRITLIDVDPDWADTATSMAIIEAVAEALGRAHALIDRGHDQEQPLGAAQRELADICSALDDWERG